MPQKYIKGPKSFIWKTELTCHLKLRIASESLPIIIRLSTYTRIQRNVLEAGKWIMSSQNEIGRNHKVLVPVWDQHRKPVLDRKVIFSNDKPVPYALRKSWKKFYIHFFWQITEKALWTSIWWVAQFREGGNSQQGAHCDYFSDGANFSWKSKPSTWVLPRITRRDLYRSTRLSEFCLIL